VSDASATAAELDLLRAALLGDERAIAGWNRWRTARDRLDVAPRLLPLAEWNLRRLSGCGSLTGLVPDPLQATWISNQRVLEGVSPALEALVAEGIEVVAFKGLALATTVYPSLATRPIGDADLLVRRADLARALRAMAELGWRETGDRAPSARTHLHGFELVRNGLAVDLHASALYECRAPDADRGFWRRRRPVRVGDAEIATLAPSDHLLLLCVHGQRWSSRQAVHWMADATVSIRAAGDDLDWETLVSEAETRSLELPVSTALRLLREELEAEVPEEPLARLERARPTRWQRREASWRGLPPSLGRGFFLHWCDWRRINPSRPSTWCAVRFPRYLAELWGVGLAALPLELWRKVRSRA
jgi:hypothetical protein